MNHQSRFDAVSLGLVPWDDPEGWYREGGERGVQDGEHKLLYNGNKYREHLLDQDVSQHYI